MTIGAALLLIAAGAVLRFAIATSSIYGVDLHIIGDILMGVGALGLVLWLVVWLPRTRSRRPYEPPPPPPDVSRRDAYRDPYRGQRYPNDPYRAGSYPADPYAGQRYPADQYPTKPYPGEPY